MAEIKSSFNWQNLPRPFSVLAPMIDVTDTCFRQLVKRWSAPDVLYAEFVSVDTWCQQGREAVQERLVFDPVEQPLIAQVWGKSPEHYAQVVPQLMEFGFAGIDINMGCSSPLVLKKGSCAKLIEDRGLAQEIVLATQEATKGQVPVSIKTRIGFAKVDTEQWACFLLGFKPNALIVHGRITKDQMRHNADWDEIAKVVRLKNELSPNTVVIGNGDVTSYTQIQAQHEDYEVDGVMVGRGALQDPFMFRPDGFSINSLSATERLELLQQHLDVFASSWGTQKRFTILKKYIKIYVAGYLGAEGHCASLVRARSINHARSLLNDIRATQSA